MDKRVTEYISQSPVWQSAIMAELRKAVHDSGADITETIKWGSPTFECQGIVAWMFAANKWVHFSFPQGKLLDHQHKMFEEPLNDSDSKAKRTIKLREGDTVPSELISRLVRQAAANNLAGEKVEFNTHKPGQADYDAPTEYKEFLADHGLLEEYDSRPYYQRKGWITWIESAKRDTTRQKRKEKMLQELRDGTYMPPKNSI